ncbi:MAG: alpha-amylase [Jatrophihabitans sp.]|uniref:alpha-amylase n=1 Tax=Jatrophihabitans sp. TaxID=1932789 RepID=UPI003F81C721
MHVPHGRTRRLLAAGLTSVLAGVAVTATAVDAPAATPSARSAHHVIRDVQANLWEWNWPSIAKECTTVLGPAGYSGVQVAPPADSLSRDYTSSDAPILHPWWEVYQPVDYRLTSRFGTATQFRDMVATCRRAGVKVYVDAVINHMTGQGHTSYTGVEYTHFDYPGLYTSANFHHKGTGPNDCPSASGGVDDFNDYHQLTKCELLGLADLRTDSAPTRAKIVAYLNRLLAIGVSGFRVDAAKHIGVADLITIRNSLHDTIDGTRPQWALEVFPGSPGEGSQLSFTRAGTVLGFDASYQLKNAFKSYTADGTGNIAGLRVWGEQAGLVPSSKSLVFVENHDTERGSDTLSYKDGATNIIANEFLLAYGYGTPQVYSAFAFTNSYDSPPATAAGYVTNTTCGKGWVCVDRNRGVLGLVRFHNAVGHAPVRHVFSRIDNVLGFSRGDQGYFLVDNAKTARTVTVQTGLRPGRYCDVVHGGKRHGTCLGAMVRVRADGTATMTVAGKDAIAIDWASKL